MGFIKNAILGIALFEGIKYLTKKDEFGNSKFSELKEKAPKLVEKAKALKEDLLGSDVLEADELS